MFTVRNQRFFNTFPDFTANPSASPRTEFARLATHRKWKVGAKLWRRHWRACFDTEFQPDDISDSSDSQPADTPSSAGGSPSFFASFAGFTPDPSAGIAAEFARLARHMGWGKNSDGYREQRLRAYEAEFEQHYGADASKLENWQALCREVGVVPVPVSVTQCKKALKKVHVNLVDLVNRRRSGGGKVRVFGSVGALRAYTQTSGKIFPKKAAKNDGFLKALLREIFNGL